MAEIGGRPRVDTGQWIKMLELFVGLVQSLIWPAVVVFLVLYFGKPLQKLLSEVREGSFKASPTGLEGAFKREAEVAAAIGLAEGRRRASAGPSAATDDDGDRSDALVSQHIADSVAQAIHSGSPQRFANATVLWVDDHPENNVYEMNALRALGIDVTTSTSTEDALERLTDNPGRYSVIISDMGRGWDKQAGYQLLEQVNKLGRRTPFIIYAGSNSPEHRAEAHRRGAFGSTDSPQELFRLVTRAIQPGAPVSGAT